MRPFIISCSAMSSQQLGLGKTDFKVLAMGKGLSMCQAFVGGDNAPPSLLMERGQKTGCILKCWMVLVQEM